MRCEGSSRQQKPAAGKIYMTSVKHQHLDFLRQSVTGKPWGLTDFNRIFFIQEFRICMLHNSLCKLFIRTKKLLYSKYFAWPDTSNLKKSPQKSVTKKFTVMVVVREVCAVCNC